MIDITNEILTKLKLELVDIDVKTSYPTGKSVFPCVVIEEIDNSHFTSTKDSAGFHHSNIGFEINIFTIGTAKMTSAKKIRNQIDNLIVGTYGMNRNVSRPTPNFLDENVYKYTMRYSGVIDNEKTIYRGY